MIFCHYEKFRQLQLFGRGKVKAIRKRSWSFTLYQVSGFSDCPIASHSQTFTQRNVSACKANLKHTFLDLLYSIMFLEDNLPKQLKK